jgi:hypothetical protein
MELKRGIRVEAGKVRGTIFGGPFRQYVPGTRRLIGVKMAAEIDHPHDVSVPTEDFSVPDPDDLTQGIMDAFTALSEGSDVYVGCMGGVGRTGLFMSVLFRAVCEYNDTSIAPVPYVRKHYNAHAVETTHQRQYVTTFNVQPLVEYLMKLNEPTVVIREVEVKVVEYRERGVFGSIAHFWGLVK